MLGGHIPRFTGTALHQLVARERGKVRAPGRVSMAFRWNMVKHGLVMCHGPTLDDYIPGNPKASFFSIVRGWHVFSVITGLLVGLKARSGEPKYGLLTRVKSKRNFGFLLGFYQYCSVFSGELLGWVRLWANFGPKSIKLTCFFHQMLLIFSQDETGTYRLLTIFFSHCGKKHAKLEIRL
jgi:hypothetical protein